MNWKSLFEEKNLNYIVLGIGLEILGNVLTDAYYFFYLNQENPNFPAYGAIIPGVFVLYWIGRDLKKSWAEKDWFALVAFCFIGYLTLRWIIFN